MYVAFVGLKHIPAIDATHNNDPHHVKTGQHQWCYSQRKAARCCITKRDTLHYKDPHATEQDAQTE